MDCGIRAWSVTSGLCTRTMRDSAPCSALCPFGVGFASGHGSGAINQWELSFSVRGLAELLQQARAPDAVQPAERWCKQMGCVDVAEIPGKHQRSFLDALQLAPLERQRVARVLQGQDPVPPKRPAQVDDGDLASPPSSVQGSRDGREAQVSFRPPSRRESDRSSMSKGPVAQDDAAPPRPRVHPSQRGSLQLGDLVPRVTEPASVSHGVRTAAPLAKRGDSKAALSQHSKQALGMTSEQLSRARGLKSNLAPGGRWGNPEMDRSHTSRR
mmetsp:Transcript_74453/g.198587  ORF Transcript_74453/g.198587 Transcript_74453/m.198587 type:complete len:270 (+) Transcript_74453:726-1535(+)